MRLQLLLITMVLAAGCSGGGDSVCSRYADLEVRCGDIPENERDLTLKLAEGMCREAMKEKSDDELAASFRAEAACAKVAKSCGEYEECKARSAAP